MDAKCTQPRVTLTVTVSVDTIPKDASVHVALEPVQRGYVHACIGVKVKTQGICAHDKCTHISSAFVYVRIQAHVDTYICGMCVTNGNPTLTPAYMHACMHAHAFVECTCNKMSFDTTAQMC